MLAPISSLSPGWNPSASSSPGPDLGGSKRDGNPLVWVPCVFSERFSLRSLSFDAFGAAEAATEAATERRVFLVGRTAPTG